MASQPRPERRSGCLYQKLATRGPRDSARKGVYMLEGVLVGADSGVKGRRHVSQSALYAHGRWTNNKESEQHMSEAGVWSANVRAFGSTHDGR